MQNNKIYITIAIALSAGFISSIGFGILAPLFALRMDDYGLSNATIGFAVTIIGAAPLFLTPFVPHVLKFIATKNALLIAIFFNATLYIALLYTHSPAAWTIARIGFAISGTFLFVASESWILELAPAKYRGQIFGIYAVIFYGGIGLGGFMISQFGYQSNLTIIIAIILNFAVLPLFLIKTIAASRPNIEGQNFFSIYKLIFLFPVLFMPALAIGGLETAAFNLFPIWVRENQLEDKLAGLMLGACAIGNVILQWPIGILGDKIGRKNVIILISIIAFIGPILLIQIQSPFLILAIVCIWSGFVTGFYTMGLVGVAESFDTKRIASANASFGTTYCIGQLFAPFIGGSLMEGFGPQALMLCLSFIALLPLFAILIPKKL